ncbi:prolactin-3D4-like [Meriones unguiculatus]|uniref:prolactin-3D4-like n=1 Tax=Meriones unguiculatus TaxID=10047 RepID=UPI000B4F63FE|nr:prolactin-3D4-like [Meriones unguiculatus]XP_060228602.1 prolactin-3D4-like [Meriones unguiculatus]
MRVTLTLPGSGMYLLLLVSNVLLWENVASNPTTLVSIEDLYHRVVEQSHNTYIVAADIYREFDLNFAKRSWLRDRIPSMCHTSSIHTPEDRKQVHETTTVDLLKAILNVTYAWEEPVKHLLPAVTALPGVSDNMMKKAVDMKGKIHILVEGIETILNRTETEPGFDGNDYPAWTGLEDLKSSDEDTRLFTIYNLCRCLRRDTHKVDSYLKVLRCRVVFKNECF